MVRNADIIGNNDNNTLTNNSTSGLTYMEGRGGNDTYMINNISTTFTSIEDEEGTNTLKIKNISGTDLVFLFDIPRDGEGTYINPYYDGVFVIKKDMTDSVVAQLKDFMLSGEEITPQSGGIEYLFGDQDDANWENKTKRILAVDTNGVTYAFDLKSYAEAVTPKVRKFLRENGYNSTIDAIQNASPEKLSVLIDLYKNTPINYAATGTTGNETILGGSGNDTLKGSAGNDVLAGGSGNDKLYGEDGNDRIKAGDGNDAIWGGKGNDEIYLQYGDNIMFFDAGDGNDTIIPGTGSDIVQFNNINTASDFVNALNISSKDNISLTISYTDKDSITIKDFFTANSIKKIKAKDGSAMALSTLMSKMKININASGEFTGHSQHEYIIGSNGDDIIKAKGGNDTIIGGSGNDKLYGGEGNDRIEGGDGDDIIQGDAGDDALYGLNGDDKIKAGEGNDFVNGGAGNDIIWGESGNNRIIGGAGNDKVYAGTGVDTLEFASGSGKDVIYYANQDDILKFTDINAADISTVLKLVKSGNHLAIQRKGTSDEVKIMDYFTTDAAQRVDKIATKDGKTVSIKAQKINITGSGTIKGTELSEAINGSSGVDTIIMGAGNDVTAPGKGDDIVYTGVGENKVIINKGDGNDKIFHEGSKTTLKINAPSTKDTVTFTKKNNDLILTYTHEKLASETAAVKETINFRNYFNTDGTPVSEEIYLQTNSVQKISDMIKKQGLIINSTTANGETIIGSALNDVITGSASNDIIKGKIGDDTIKGGAGNDTIEGNEGNDKIYGNTGNDVINAGTGNNTLYFASGDGDDKIISGGGTDTLVFTSETNINNIKAKVSGNNLLITYTGGTVTLKDFMNIAHSVKYIQVGNTKKSITDFIPGPETKVIDGENYITGTVAGDYISATNDATYHIWGNNGNDNITVLGIDTNAAEIYGGAGNDTITAISSFIDGGAGDDTITHTYGYNWKTYENNKNTLKTQYGATDAWIDKYSSDLYRQAGTVSNEYYNVKQVFNDINLYKFYLANYDNPNYTGDTYFRMWTKSYYENALAQTEASAYGVNYVYNTKREEILSHFDNPDSSAAKKALADFKYSEEYAKWKNVQDNIAKYKTYVADLSNVPSFRDIAENIYGEGNGKQYWIDKLNAVSDNINGFTGSKQILDSLLDTYAEGDASFAELLSNYRQFGDSYKDEYEEALDNIMENNDDISEAYSAYLADLETYNRYSEYARNYYNEEFLGTDYEPIEGTSYISFRQEANAEAKVIHDYYGKQYRLQAGDEYWSAKASEIWKKINGYQGSLSLMNEFYLRSKEGDPRHMLYDIYRQYRDEYWDNVDAYELYATYIENWDNPSYKGESGDNVMLRKDEWQNILTNERRALNGTVSVYNDAVDTLNNLVTEIKESAPTQKDAEAALKILTNLDKDIILGGDGNDNITIGHLDPSEEFHSYSDVLAMGQNGNDTYSIENYSSVSTEIYDHVGNNILKLESDELRSGNIGIFANVTLEKDSNGEFVKDGSGNYAYKLENFGSTINDAGGINAILERTPYKNGDAGYSVLIVDAENFKDKYAFSYGAYNDTDGIKLDNETLEHMKYIYSADNKYVTKAQLNAMLQKTANILAERGYGSFMEAMCLENNDYEKRCNNLSVLTSSRALGSLEWITPSEGVLTGKTSGLIGTNTDDKLVSTSAAETFDLKFGNDTITFSGKFGKDTVISSSTTDNNGNAVQADTFNVKDYSVIDGSLKFSQRGNDLVLTAYDGETVKGLIIYQGFLGTDYTSRTFYLNAKDHTYTVSYNNMVKASKLPGSNLTALNIDDQTNDNYNIRFIRSSGKDIIVYANENRGYYYTLGNTPISFSTKNGEVKEIFSLGNTNDRYNERITEDTNIIIHDEGGLDVLSSTGTWSESWTDAKMRFFFDINSDGEVAEAKHIIWTKNFYVPTEVEDEHGYTITKNFYATDELIKLLNNDPEHMKGVITIYGDIEKITNDQHQDLAENVWVDSNEDESMRYWKLIQSVAVDVVPWLKENGYESVVDALTQLKAEINTVQNEMGVIDLSGVERYESGAINQNTIPENYKTLKAEYDALQAKIDELLGFYNNEYDYILNINLFGTDESEEVKSAYYNLVKYIEGKKGNDIIDPDSHYREVKYVYDLERGDGHDTILNTYKDDIICLKTGSLGNVTPKFRTDGWDLILEMYYKNPSAISNPDGSIRIKEYFRNKNLPERIDKIIIQSDGEDDEVLSINELLEENGVINSNVTLGTMNADEFTGTAGNDIYYTNGVAEGYDFDMITSSKGNDTYYLTKQGTASSNAPAKFTYTVGDGDDIIYDANYMTYLTLNFDDKDISMEFRKTDDNDIRMVFFDYNGNDLGSITIKDSDIHWKEDGTIATQYGSSFLNHGSTDTFFIKKNDDDIGTAYKLRDLVKTYTDSGANLAENNDAPYIRVLKITPETANGLQITNIGKVDRLDFDNSFKSVKGSLSGNDLILTYGNSKTLVIKGYVTGTSSVYDAKINGVNRTIGDLTGLYYGTTGDDVFIHSKENNATVTYNLNTGNDRIEFQETPNRYDAYENGTKLYNKAVIYSQGGTQATDKLVLTDYNVFDSNNLKFGFASDGTSITIKGEKDFNPTTLVNYHKNTDITYKNFMADTSPNLIVETANDYDYAVHKYNSAQNINVNDDYLNEDGQHSASAHVVFINDSNTAHTSNIIGTNYNQIITTGGAALNYTGYERDMIVTNSTKSNDTYNVSYINSGLQMNITDKGGSNDTLNLQNLAYNEYSNDVENLYLSFNLDSNGNYLDNKTALTFSYTQSGAIWNVATRVLSGVADSQSGSIIIDAARQNGKNFGIEKVVLYKSDNYYDENGDYQYAQKEFGRIDMEAWYNELKQDVTSWLSTNAAWLNEHDCTSTADVFALDTYPSEVYNKVSELTAIYEAKNASQFTNYIMG